MLAQSPTKQLLFYDHHFCILIFLHGLFLNVFVPVEELEHLKLAADDFFIIEILADFLLDFIDLGPNLLFTVLGNILIADRKQYSLAATEEFRVQVP